MSELWNSLKQQIAQHNWGLFGPTSYVLGVDLGSYGIRAVVTDICGQHLFHAATELAPESTATIVLEQSFSLIHELLETNNVPSQQLVRIGVGFGGPVDAVRGITRRSYRMAGWDDLNVCEQFEAAFDAQTLIENDASLIAFGEYMFGAGRDVQDLYYLHLSTGVGSGLVLNGQLHRGITTSAGEIGHARYSLNHQREIEDLLSIRGLLARANELGLATDDLDVLFNDANAGAKTISEAVEVLGLGLAGVVQLLDPALLVLGGIVTRKGGDALCSAVEAQVNQLISPTPQRHISVVHSLLGAEAVAIGGLALALQSLNQ